MSEPNLAEFLYQALNEPLGLVIETNDAERLRAKLYPIRKEDPALGCLTFTLHPANPKTHLCIIRKPEKPDGQA